MEPLIDFNFLQELSAGDSKYIYELLDIFLSTTPEGLINIEQLIKETNDWEATYKQAHFLKSSVGIVKIREMHPQLARIEELGRKEEGREEIEQLIEKIMKTFNEAHPILIAERDKHKQLAGVA